MHVSAAISCLLVSFVLVVTGCGRSTSSVPTPTPDLEATVAARVRATLTSGVPARPPSQTPTTPTSQPVANPSSAPRTPTSRPATESKNVTVTPVTQPIEEAKGSKYLPLASGNKWVYRKKVVQNVFSWEAYENIKNKSVEFAIGTVKDIQPGESEETYVVKGHIIEDGRQFWEIGVSSKTARDGRYGTFYTGPDTILWGRVPSSIDLIEIGEILIRESRLIGTKKQTRTLLAEPVLEDVKATLIPLGSESVSKYIEYIASAKRVDIEVPGGNFRGCLEMISNVKEQSGDGDWAKGWSTYAYYAPGVGLVKEIQKDAKNNATYTLELTAYDVRQ